MYHIMATFKNFSDFKHFTKSIRTNLGLKSHMTVIPKQYPINTEKEISSVLMRTSREISSSGLDDIRLGVILGCVIGAISAFLAFYFNASLLHLSPLSLLAGIMIIFCGGTAGAVLGFLLHIIMTKHIFNKGHEEVSLFIQKIDESDKELILQNLETYHAENIQIY